MSLIKNLLVVFSSFFFSFLIAELVVRAVTDYPTYENKVIDSRFGYKVNSKLEDVDELGFRNPDDKIEQYEIAAIGDSHTYGYNVAREKAWPSQLENIIEKPIYNFGIGGNGIYSYHFLVKEALKNNKKVIIGLYLPNDFQTGGYVCSIDFKNLFWESEVGILQLNPPGTCDLSKNVPENKSTLKEMARMSAMISLGKDYIEKPIKEMFRDDKPVINIYDRFSPIELSRLKGHSVNTDLENSSMSNVYSDFKKMAMDWKNLSNGSDLGVILIPSRQMVYREALIQLNVDLDKDNMLRQYTDNELILEKDLFDFFNSLEIPARSVKSKIVEEFIASLPSKGVEQFYPDSGHPGEAGYRAYAQTAAELYLEMTSN